MVGAAVNSYDFAFSGSSGDGIGAHRTPGERTVPVDQTRPVHELTASAVEEAARFLAGGSGSAGASIGCPACRWRCSTGIGSSCRLRTGTPTSRRAYARASHLFRIASHSKTFTATAVLQLVE